MITVHQRDKRRERRWKCSDFWLECLTTTVNVSLPHNIKHANIICSAPVKRKLSNFMFLLWQIWSSIFSLKLTCSPWWFVNIVTLTWACSKYFLLCYIQTDVMDTMDSSSVTLSVTLSRQQCYSQCYSHCYFQCYSQQCYSQFVQSWQGPSSPAAGAGGGAVLGWTLKFKIKFLLWF